jgi:hypothetical protein
MGRLVPTSHATGAIDKAFGGAVPLPPTLAMRITAYDETRALLGGLISSIWLTPRAVASS